MNVWVAICISFETLVALLSAGHYRSLKKHGLGSFPFFMFFVCLGEITGFILARIYHTNLVFYNVFSTLQVIYYLLLIRKQLNESKARKAIIISIIFYVLAFITNSCFFQFINQNLGTYTFTLGCLLISFWVVYFFYELFVSKEVDTYGRNPFFWIGLGLFLFYVCNIPYMSVYNYLASNYQHIFSVYFNMIIEILNYVMYTFFIIGILCTNKRK